MVDLTRRGALVALASIPAMGGALAASTSPVAETPCERVTRLAKELSAAMEDMHGGDWRVSVNHEHGFALIVKYNRPVQS